MSTTGDHSKTKYGHGREALGYFAEAFLPPDENIIVT